MSMLLIVSALVSQISVLEICLQAALYETDFRPVPLEEFIKVRNTIYNKKMDIIRTISKAAELGGKDPDHIVELCNEVGKYLLPLLLNMYMHRE